VGWKGVSKRRKIKEGDYLSDTGLLVNPENIAYGCLRLEIRATRMEITKERIPPSTTATPSGNLQVTTLEKRKYFSSTPKGRKGKNRPATSGNGSSCGAERTGQTGQ
jgi:hypothetical protein